jgi:DNA-directed RNA polymerase subunit RPC12/RpoP
MADEELKCPKCGEPLEYAWVDLVGHYMYVCYGCRVKIDPPDSKQSPVQEQTGGASHSGTGCMVLVVCALLILYKVLESWKVI